MKFRPNIKSSPIVSSNYEVVHQQDHDSIEIVYQPDSSEEDHLTSIPDLGAVGPHTEDEIKLMIQEEDKKLETDEERMLVDEILALGNHDDIVNALKQYGQRGAIIVKTDKKGVNTKSSYSTILGGEKNHGFVCDSSTANDPLVSNFVTFTVRD